MYAESDERSGIGYTEDAIQNMKGQTDRWPRRVDGKGLRTITPFAATCVNGERPRARANDGFEYRLRGNEIKNKSN